MPIIETHNLIQGERTPYSDWVYNGLDCLLTYEVHEALESLLNDDAKLIYSFERALQAPAMEMMLRGIKVDEYERQKGLARLREETRTLDRALQRLAHAVWGKELNPRSQKQLQGFFYEAMGIPKVWKSAKGKRTLSMDRETLEKLEVYFYARPIIGLVLAIRDIAKTIDTLTSEVDRDGRYRTSINIGGTECVAGDTLVLTKMGLQRMDAIFEKPRVQVWDGSGFYKPVRTVCYKNAQGFEITTKYGYQLRCSANHPIMTQRGFVEAHNLLPTDAICFQFGYRQEWLWGHAITPKFKLETKQRTTSKRATIPEAISRELCEFIGMWLADGSLDNSLGQKRIRLSNQDADARTRFKELGEGLFGVAFHDNGRNEVHASSFNMVEWLVKLGCSANGGRGTANLKNIPSWLLSAKAPMLRALLRGLTLDSHFTEKGLAYGTQSVEMREQLQQILLALGIISYKLEVGNGIKLQIPHSYTPRFAALVGFVQSWKLETCAHRLNTVDRWHEPLPPYQNHFIEIESIIPWVGDVYDVTMPDKARPQYIGNGMLVHNTGRLSSSKTVEGTGMNLQNLTRDEESEDSEAFNIRRIFIADDNKVLVSIDLEQTESFDVGWLHGTITNDWKYLDACERSGDLHTFVTRMVWPELGWGDDPKANRKIADRHFYRNYSYRDMAKRGGHLTNYYGTAWTMAKSLKIPEAMAQNFQDRYAYGREAAFPGFTKWWQNVAQQLQTTQELRTPYGRVRHFFGRPNDDATLREAIAFVPQSMTADRMNLGMWRTWKHAGKRVELLLQVHDSIVFQIPMESDWNAIISEVKEYLRVPLSNGSRTMCVGSEAKVGWNLSNYHPERNRDGLRKWTGVDERERTTLMGRIL